MFANELMKQTEKLIGICAEQKLKLSVAESCTGGLIGACLTAVAGASEVFDRGFVTYSNHAKRDMLGISETVLRAHGAVSEETVRAMAEGALKLSGSDLSVAVTGIAGPGGGGKDRPVGLVHFATTRKDSVTLHHVERFGDLGRHEVRMRTVETALMLLMRRIS